MKQVKGDVLKMAENGDFDVVVQGCNCFHRMGAGIAKQIHNDYPQAYRADTNTLIGSKEKLGMISSALIVSEDRDKWDFTIVNAYTQFGHDAKTKPVDYWAIRECFRKIKQIYGNCRIAYPLIGAGLAGGDWEVISKIINEELEGCDHTVVIFQP